MKEFTITSTINVEAANREEAAKLLTNEDNKEIAYDLLANAEIDEIEEDEENIECGNCGRPATHSIGEDFNRCDRCKDL